MSTCGAVVGHASRSLSTFKSRDSSLMGIPGPDAGNSAVRTLCRQQRPFDPSIYCKSVSGGWAAFARERSRHPSRVSPAMRGLYDVTTLTTLQSYPDEKLSLDRASISAFVIGNATYVSGRCDHRNERDHRCSDVECPTSAIGCMRLYTDVNTSFCRLYY